MSVRILWLLAIVTGCTAPQTIGPFIHRVDVVGGDLVLEACTVMLRGDEMSQGQCRTVRRRLPVTAAVPPTLTEAQVKAELPPDIAQRVQACSETRGVRGLVIVTLEINYLGRLIDARASTGGRELADCLGSAFGGTRFPPSGRGVLIDLPFQVVSGAP
jgi:hypothetical protein